MLLEHARAGAVKLLIPSICLREGADSVRKKCQPRSAEFQKFRRSARTDETLSEADSNIVLEFLKLYDAEVSRQLRAIDRRLDELVNWPGVEIFALNDAMLARAIDLRHTPEVQQLKPFDEAILAAVLVQTEEVRKLGAADVRFCTLDTDLWPRSRKTGAIRPGLQKLYEDAGLRIQADFSV